MKIAVVFVVMSGLVSGANWTRPLAVSGNEYEEAVGRSGREPVEQGAFAAHDGQFKFMLYLYVDGKSCSGGLVKRTWVLCAANCLSANVVPTKVIAVGGKANLAMFDNKFHMMEFESEKFRDKLGVMISVAKTLIKHPKYSANTYEHDIGLIELMEPMVGPTVDTVPLSYEKMIYPMPCMIFSWGVHESNKSPFRLRYWKSKTAGTPPFHCVTKHKNYVICLRTDQAGMCLGDPGSPLLCKGKVWGVSSHGGGACRLAPEDYFSELYPELEWVHSIINSSGRRAASLRGVLAAASGAWFVSAALEVFDLFIFHHK